MPDKVQVKDGIHSQQIEVTSNGPLELHADAQDRCEDKSMLVCDGLDSITNLDNTAGCNGLSAATDLQSSPVVLRNEGHLKTLGLVEETDDQIKISKLVTEAETLNMAQEDGTDTRVEESSQQIPQIPYVASKSDTPVPETLSDNELRQTLPDPDDDELVGSDLDDDEDVAKCLLSHQESELRASNWRDKDHENPVQLDSETLARRTGVHQSIFRDLLEELRVAEQDNVCRDAEDLPSCSTSNSLVQIQKDGSSDSLVNSTCHTRSPVREGIDADEEVGIASREPSEGDGTPTENELLISRDEEVEFRCSDVFSGRSIRHDNGAHSRTWQVDSEHSQPDSSGGIAVNEDDQTLETPGSNASSGTSNPAIWKDKASDATETATTTNTSTHNEILPLPDVKVLKRIQRRSAPSALNLSHDRSDSQTTLVSSPHWRSATPSIFEQLIPVSRWLSPRQTSDGKLVIDEIEHALRVQRAVEEVKDFTDREWESVYAATELRHNNEIEDLKEENQAAIRDLREQHLDDLKSAREKHGEKMREIRSQVGKAKLKTQAVEGKLKNIMTEKDALRDELRTKDEQLKRAIAAAQALQANDSIHIYQHDVTIKQINGRQSSQNESSVGPVPEMTAQLEQQVAHSAIQVARLQDDLVQCQQTRDYYMETSNRYHKALVDTPEKKSLRELEEEKDELSARLHKCAVALDDEERARKADRELFSIQLKTMHESIQRSKLDFKAMELSRKAALDANEQSIRLMRRPVSDNDIDTAVWEQYRIVQSDYQELRHSAEGHEHEKVEKDREVNALKAKILMLGVQASKHEERILQLEDEVRQVEFNCDTAIHERDIAVQDQEKREPDLWKSIRDRALRERDEEIARLEARLRDKVAEDEPGTSIDIKDTKAIEAISLALQSHRGPLVGIEEDAGLHSPATPLHRSSPSPLFGMEEATKPHDFYTLVYGTPESHVSFF